MGLMFFYFVGASGRSSTLRKFLSREICRVAKKTKLFTVASIFIRSPRLSTYWLMDEHPVRCNIRWLPVIASARSRRFYASIGDCLETVYSKTSSRCCFVCVCVCVCVCRLELIIYKCKEIIRLGLQICKWSHPSTEIMVLKLTDSA